MNKDLDDRLIPNGEYRDAQNISVGKSEDADVGAVSSVPETVAPEGTTDNKEDIKNFVAQEIIEKFVKFVTNLAENFKAEDPSIDLSTVKDEFFNPLRKWYGILSDKIDGYNTLGDQQISDVDFSVPVE